MRRNTFCKNDKDIKWNKVIYFQPWKESERENERSEDIIRNYSFKTLTMAPSNWELKKASFNVWEYLAPREPPPLHPIKEKDFIFIWESVNTNAFIKLPQSFYNDESASYILSILLRNKREQIGLL